MSSRSAIARAPISTTDDPYTSIYKSTDPLYGHGGTPVLNTDDTSPSGVSTINDTPILIRPHGPVTVTPVEPIIIHPEPHGPVTPPHRDPIIVHPHPPIGDIGPGLIAPNDPIISPEQNGDKSETGYTPGTILLSLEHFLVFADTNGQTVTFGTPPATGYHLPPMPETPGPAPVIDGGFTPGEILLQTATFIVFADTTGNTVPFGTPPAEGYHLPPAHFPDDLVAPSGAVDPHHAHIVGETTPSNDDPVGIHLDDGGFTIYVDHDGTIVCGNLPIAPVISLNPFVPGPAPVPVAPDAVFSATGEHAATTTAVGVHLPDDGGFTMYVDHDGTVICGTPPATPIGAPAPEQPGLPYPGPGQETSLKADHTADSKVDLSHILSQSSEVQNAINDFVSKHDAPAAPVATVIEATVATTVDTHGGGFDIFYNHGPIAPPVEI